ncbi:MAG: hypothetical protein EP332_09660 [Bacteroidetes bacterium]|nr:MAG: hypothetical protein EP332_09660 [Bacteroidota bacterium]
MTKTNDKKQEYLQIVFLLLPTLILAKLGDLFATEMIYRILFAGIFGGVGGALGYLVYSRVQKKGMVTIVVAGALLGGASFSALVWKARTQMPLTCEVCGYKTIKKGDESCAYCGANTWAFEQGRDDYDNKAEWLRYEQLNCFVLDSANQVFDFYSPDRAEGFKKDMDWKPSISQQDLVDDYKAIDLDPIE